jgi:hypothetical protein
VLVSGMVNDEDPGNLGNPSLRLKGNSISVLLVG